MLKRIINWGTSISIFGGFIYGYLYYKTNKNLKEYEKVLASDTLRDASRLSNDQFGISWGFQADDIIMKRIDSGDILFVKFDCSECLCVKDFSECFMKSMLNL